MLKTVKLTNFKQHEDLTVNFTAGLNAIRGANEAGKSTLFEAIAYAFYGARALELSLEDTVTWGKLPTALKVDLEFDHVGKDYTIMRRKSGAELLGPDGLRVSGHSEVSAYIEQLFKAGMAVAIATMIAGQNQLKESLDGSAVSLIEKLSNMGLIDELVNKVQTHLPNGNTKLFETQLADLVVCEPPVADYLALNADVIQCGLNVYAATDAADIAVSEYELAKIEADAATARLSAASESEVRRKVLFHQLEKAVQLQSLPAPVCTESMSLDHLLGAKAVQQAEAVTNAKWELFSSLPKAVRNLDRAAVDAEAKGTADLVKIAKAQIRTDELKRATVLAGVITQSACGLCGKDLTDIPEVVLVNDKARATAASLDSEIAKRVAVVAEHEKALTYANSLYAADNALNVKRGMLVGYVKVDSSVIPSLVTWDGPAVSAQPDVTDYDTRITSLRRYMNTAAVYSAQVMQAAQAVATLQAELDSVPELAAVPEDRLASAAASDKLKDAQAAAALLNAAKQSETASNFALKQAEQAHAFALERHAASLAKRADLITTIETYNGNNRLVKKLREARPVVARKLWNSVLAAVSTYFSTIRGVPSVVTRGESKFMIDGKSFAAFSGSTKDALGLAIRITLQKTFLGSLDFMLVDEPASAADPARETAMLGMLATCGYGQVILVTHSDLADTFATNIIRI